MARKLKEEDELSELEMNTKKIKYLCVTSVQTSIKLGNDNIESYEEYKYLPETGD